MWNFIVYICKCIQTYLNLKLIDNQNFVSSTLHILGAHSEFTVSKFQDPLIVNPLHSPHSLFYQLDYIQCWLGIHVSVIHSTYETSNLRIFFYSTIKKSFLIFLFLRCSLKLLPIVVKLNPLHLRGQYLRKFVWKRSELTSFTAIY